METKIRIIGIVRVHEIFVPVSRPVECIEELVRRGEARKVIETSNLVTDIGLQCLAALIAGGLGVHTIGGSGFGPGNFEDLRINKMHLTVALAPPAPAPGNTVLSAATAYSFHANYPTSGDTLLSSVQLGTPGQVRFSGLVQPQDEVGSIFTEEGLLTETSKLVARTTFSYTKSANVAVQFDHDLSVARV